MSQNWKRVERMAAQELNMRLSGVGKFTPIERVPVNGREGPDLTINETGLVVNVKSRQKIHPRLLPGFCQLLFCGDLVIFRLEDITCFNTFLMDPIPVDSSKMLMDWYEKMDKWREAHHPDGISAIFLHRPQLPYGEMGVAIHFDKLRRLSCNIKSVTNPSL
jgi:hypothetical protein